MERMDEEMQYYNVTLTELVDAGARVCVGVGGGNLQEQGHAV